MSAQPLPPHLADLSKLGRQFDRAGKARRLGQRIIGKATGKRKDTDNPGADLAAQAIAGHNAVQHEHTKIFGGIVARQHSSTIADQMLNDHPGITRLNFDTNHNIDIHRSISEVSTPRNGKPKKASLEKMRARQNSAAGTYMQDNGEYSTGTPKPLTPEQKAHNAAMRSYITPSTGKAKK